VVEILKRVAANQTGVKKNRCLTHMLLTLLPLQ
jgi:hypothetical protein